VVEKIVFLWRMSREQAEMPEHWERDSRSGRQSHPPEPAPQTPHYDEPEHGRWVG
jgi:hypothetical protein